jgi:hypothetical protein
MFRKIARVKCDIDLQVSLEDPGPSPGIANELEAFCDAMNFGKRVRKKLAALGQTLFLQQS